MSVILKKHVPIGIMLILTIVLMVEYFFVVPDSYIVVTNEVKSFTVVIAAFAMALGAFNILQMHGKKVVEKKSGWKYSAWIITVMVIFIVVGLVGGSKSYWFVWLWECLLRQPDATSYSLIGFVAIYSIYTAFRIDSREILYFTCIWVISFAANAPIGPIVFPWLPAIQGWLKMVPNSAATRGFYIATALSAIVIGIRTLIGRTRAGMEG